jgi:hypothetical protein
MSSGGADSHTAAMGAEQVDVGEMASQWRNLLDTGEIEDG